MLTGSFKMTNLTKPLLADRVEGNEIEEHAGRAKEVKYIYGLVEKPEGKRPRGWKNNVTGNLKHDGMA
jgi:hypothetical protein